MSSWQDRWQKTGQEFSGGQGQSFAVTSTDARRLPAFVKTLKRRKDREARTRFRREVVAYETLSRAGLPRLYEDNSTEWDHGEAALYMVLELIPGMNLDQYMRANGPLDENLTRALASSLIDCLAACHNEGYVHRDVKPRNIVLRDGSPTTPVLIDFGLSFNSSMEEEDITKVGEEIGNRFLRLPEQASGIRSPLSDISRTAGVIFYCLTGLEPKVLTDENSAMPHQRPAAAELLERLEPSALRNRLLGFFDRAFASSTEFRFQNIRALQAAFEAVFVVGDDEDDFESLLAQVDNIAQSADVAQIGISRTRLDTAIQRISSIVGAFATARSLQVSQTAHQVHAGDSPPAGSTRLAVYLDRGVQPTLESWVTYEVRLVGQEVIFSVAGETRWRGSNLDDESFGKAVMTVAARQFLSIQQD